MAEKYPMTGAYAPTATCKHGDHPYDCRQGCDPHEHARYYHLHDRIRELEEALTAEKLRFGAMNAACKVALARIRELEDENYRLNMEIAAYRQGCTPKDAAAMLAVVEMKARACSRNEGPER